MGAGVAVTAAPAGTGKKKAVASLPRPGEFVGG